jgi:hypothetical protein
MFGTGVETGVTTGQWPVVLVILVVLVVLTVVVVGGILLAIKLACDGTESGDRAEVIKAIAELFKEFFKWLRGLR